MCAHTCTVSSLIITLNYNPYVNRFPCLTRLMQYAALLSHEHTENSLLAVWLVEADWETFIIIDANISVRVMVFS